jgi:protein-S-isoprenylcysteine O-methyltransferase Ste14
MKKKVGFWLSHIVWPIFIAQYILAFFVYNLPGWPPLQAVGWGIWVISLIFGIAPILILGRRGDVPQGKSYVATTRLVDTSLYAIVRHPQYLAGILFNIALMLMAQHVVVILLGLASAVLLYIDIQDADREGIEKFGEEYRPPRPLRRPRRPPKRPARFSRSRQPHPPRKLRRPRRLRRNSP